MLRFFWSAFALACGIVQASSAPPIPQDDSGNAPMRFEWRREGPAQVCGTNCRVWISAVGYITADTPREFETFAKDPNVRGAVLVLDSDGGSVLGTLALGTMVFIPAGTLNYWQGWAYFGTSIFASALYALYLVKYDPALLQRRQQAGPSHEKSLRKKSLSS